MKNKLFPAFSVCIFLIFRSGSCFGISGEDTVPDASADGNPEIRFKTVPAATTIDRFARFEFDAPKADHFSCQLDNLPPAACISPLLLMPRKTGDTLLAKGVHTLRVRAAANGKWGRSQSVSWKIVGVLDQANVNSRMVRDLISTGGQIPPDFRGAGDDVGKVAFLKGIARFKCLESHAAYNDPIVYPDMPGHAHLHSFWGNDLTDANSTAESLFTSGNTTCQGNYLNRSAYWVPALLAPEYDSMGKRIGWQAVVKDADPRAVARGLFHETYYYSAVVTDVSSITVPPTGLRIIAGNASATASLTANNKVMDDPNYIVHWYCAQRRSKPHRLQNYDNHIPECPLTYDAAGRPNSLVHFVIRFPSCWDGINLDSADHKSHMAYPVFGTSAEGNNTVRCPADHPVAIPEVSYHYSYAVTDANADPISKTSRGWRLSSDNYTVGESAGGMFVYGGYSLHGDWFNAWHPEVIQAFIDGCLKQHKDCSEGQLGSPSNDGVYYQLGIASRSNDPIYPVLPNTDLGGMPVGWKMQH